MKHCLIIDSSSVVRKVARRILEGSSWLVTEAVSGEDAIDQCKMQMPDAILVDWMLPAMAAQDFVTALRMTPDGRIPVIIYCTTKNDPVDISRMLAIGADDYILKPFTRLELKEKLDPVQRAA